MCLCQFANGKCQCSSNDELQHQCHIRSALRHKVAVMLVALVTALIDAWVDFETFGWMTGDCYCCCLVLLTWHANCGYVAIPNNSNNFRKCLQMHVCMSECDVYLHSIQQLSSWLRNFKWPSILRFLSSALACSKSSAEHAMAQRWKYNRK